jgi:hypothetical protein
MLTVAVNVTQATAAAAPPAALGSQRPSISPLKAREFSSPVDAKPTE